MVDVCHKADAGGKMRRGGVGVPPIAALRAVVDDDESHHKALPSSQEGVGFRIICKLNTGYFVDFFPCFTFPSSLSGLWLVDGTVVAPSQQIGFNTDFRFHPRPL